MKSLNTYLSLSETESRIFGLKVGRSERLDSFDENLLLKDIIEREFDICRIKTDAANKNIFKQLDYIGIPYHLYNVLSQSGKITGPEDLINPGESKLSGEVYDGSQKETLYQLVGSAVSEDTGVNFFNFYFENCLPLQKRVEAAQQYAHAFIHSQNPGKTGWIFKYREEYVGFCLLLIEKTFGDLVFFGVGDKFRGLGFSREIQKYALDFCYRNKIAYMGGDIAIQNVGSLKSVLNVGGSQRKSYFNFILTPFFSHSAIPAKEFSFRPVKKPLEEMVSIILEEVEDFKKRKITSIKIKETGSLICGKDYLIKITIPVDGENQLVLARVYGREKKLVCFSYIEFGG